MNTRNRKEMRTGYQEIAPWVPEIDLQCDFVMVYGLDDTLQERIAKFREKGYEVCLMTGCAWGNYEDYLNGTWDGRQHWEECQTDREGKPILHGVNTPYMVPTASFTDYLSEHLRGLVDEGIAAIFMEEPEFWDAGGYSKAFQQEYEAYYGTPWEAPHTSVDAEYRCAKLKAWLYARLVEKLSKEVKTYSMERYGRETGFYVATHSLLNYTQWKIMSPESALVSFEHVDGFIAQVWSGTSGTGNVYEGHYRSRTFETAYLEYGIMQEMIKNTDKKMWFLHDPVEDFPENTWEVYRKKYLKTLTASLFWPQVNHYEVCPWPNRVINGRYPKKLGMAHGMIPTTDMEGAKDMPTEYATMLSSMIQMLGDMPTEGKFLGKNEPVGIVISDSSLYQRSFPDVVLRRSYRNAGAWAGTDAAGQRETIWMKGKEQAVNDRVVALRETEHQEDFYCGLQQEQDALYAYMAGCTYPGFFGLTMPLLKHGLPLQPVYLEHTGRYEDYLKNYRYLILSYEFMKPEQKEYQERLVEWVKEGGCLIYVGDGSDPYHTIRSWWNAQECGKAADESLFEALGVGACPQDGTYSVEKGRVAIWNIAPALLTTDSAYAKKYRSFIKNVLADTGYEWAQTNSLVMERGPYRLISVMDESCSKEPYRAAGNFADLCTDGYPLIHEISVPCGEERILFDYDRMEANDCYIVATAARVERLSFENERIELWEKAADRIHVHTRMWLSWRPMKWEAVDEDGIPVPLQIEWEEESHTVLLSYDSIDKLVKITGTCENTEKSV